MNDEVLRVNHLKKYFKTGRGLLHAVDDVSFSIQRGETIGVVGESGCGKSTLGRTVLRLNEPTDGEILFHGENLVTAPKNRMKEIRPKMQMIFQDPYSSLNGRMTVRQLIAEPLIVNRTCRSRAEMDERIDRMMETVGLASRLDMTYPHELDGGRRQRIGIARTLVLEPEFVVCDEPVSALDVSIQAQILNLMKQLQRERGLTYMFITHDLSVVRHFSDDIAVMYLGRLVEKAPAEELFAHPMHPYTKALLSAIPNQDIDKKTERIIIKGELTSPIEPAPVCRFAKRCNYCSERCTASEPKLMEVSPNHFVSCFLCE